MPQLGVTPNIIAILSPKTGSTKVVNTAIATPSTSVNTSGVKAFTQSMPFVLSFLTGTIFLQMILGNDITYKFLWLVLISMVLINGDKITNLLNGVKKLYE